jgi:hypothetical protein
MIVLLSLVMSMSSFFATSLMVLPLDTALTPDQVHEYLLESSSL